MKPLWSRLRPWRRQLSRNLCWPFFCNKKAASFSTDLQFHNMVTQAAASINATNASFCTAGTMSGHYDATMQCALVALIIVIGICAVISLLSYFSKTASQLPGPQKGVSDTVATLIVPERSDAPSSPPPLSVSGVSDEVSLIKSPIRPHTPASSTEESLNTTKTGSRRRRRRPMRSDNNGIGTSRRDVAARSHAKSKYLIPKLKKLFLKHDEADQVRRAMRPECKWLIKGTRRVYRARTWRGHVAIKTFGGSRQRGPCDRLVAETQLLAHCQQLRCPFIVSMYGVECCPAPQGWFLAMEYVGPDLWETLLANPRLNITVRRKLAADVAQGVAALHSLGVFHRDIKPANAVVRPDLSRAKICDFGLSVRLHMPRSTKTKRSVDKKYEVAHCGLLGTPNHMAPEQHLQGRRMRRLTMSQAAAIDVYALGVTLLTVFTNRRAATFFPHPHLRNYYRDLAACKSSCIKRGVDVSTVVSTASKGMTSPILSIIEQCLVFNPESRPSAERVAKTILSSQPHSTTASCSACATSEAKLAALAFGLSLSKPRK